ncbi:MAG: hypothetical protein HY907_11200 [Deltaproteobacteria bacterium]|nr:hypothetical protein [Deltaproteobacteria bacterium]
MKPLVGLAFLAASLACAQSTTLPADAGDAEAHDDAGDGAGDRGDTATDGACRPGEELCSGVCADLTTDPAHCGTCSTTCAPGEVCNEAHCASSCTGGLENCSGACVDLQTDEAHCGSCADPCALHEECRSGHCTCVPDCTGRECGSDGCTATCGDCPAGRECGDDGRCFCAENCVGRTCGDDGCGGSCGGCDPGFACTPAGTCSCGGTLCGALCCTGAQVCLDGACCDPTWSTSVPGVSLRGLVRDAGGTLFAAGSSGTQAWVAAFDACGNRLREHTFVSGTATSTGLAGLTLAGDDLYAVGQTLESGADPGNGVWARLPKATLVPAWTNVLWGGNDLDEAWAVAVSGSDVWIAGSGAITATGSFPWVIRGLPDGGACGFNPFPASSGGVGRDVVLNGGRAYVAGARGGEAFLTSWAAGECAWTPPLDCPCEPTGTTVAFQASGAAYTEARAVVALGSGFYVAGFSDVGGDLGGMVVRIAATVVTEAPRWNPTTLVDAYTALAAEATGSAVYATGTMGWDGAGEAGSAVVSRYGTAGVTAEWQVNPPGAWGCWDLVVDDLGGIVVGCLVPGGGSTLRRCLPTGVCP